MINSELLEACDELTIDDTLFTPNIYVYGIDSIFYLTILCKKMASRVLGQIYDYWKQSMI